LILSILEILSLKGVYKFVIRDFQKFFIHGNIDFSVSETIRFIFLMLIKIVLEVSQTHTSFYYQNVTILVALPLLSVFHFI
jgi:hypothetical protein